ncbi:ethanolamine utilization protein EutH, partial [Mesorhizobium sp. M00.F.Ca.ET.186.01.1.1]
MEHIGSVIIYIIMLCAVIGAIAAIRNSDEGLGKEFMEGIHSTGYIFVPAAGIMASLPYISWFVEKAVSPIFHKIGADPALAATAILASDMGGYQLANILKSSTEGWVMAMVVGLMAGATIVFSIPMGLAMLDKRDHKYMALGVMSGILTVPIGAFITSAILSLTNAQVRAEISTNADSTYAFAIGIGQVLLNLSPILIFVIAIA